MQLADMMPTDGECHGCGAYHEEEGIYCYVCQYGITRAADDGLAYRWDEVPDHSHIQKRAVISAMREPMVAEVLYEDYRGSKPGCVAIVDTGRGEEDVFSPETEGLRWLLVGEEDLDYCSSLVKEAESLIGKKTRVLRIATPPN